MFLDYFDRWSILFRRRDSGNVDHEKILIAEYYRSLGHLSEAGLDALTEMLKPRCTFFPTIRECLEALKADRYDWGHPFRSLNDPGPNPLLRSRPDPRLITAPQRQIDHQP